MSTSNASNGFLVSGLKPQFIRTMVQAFAEIIERQVLRFENQGAEYERKLAEHRAAFGVRTGADAKIIEGMRAEIATLTALKRKHASVIDVGEALLKERYALREEVAAYRAEVAAAEIEVARLKAQAPKRSHPAKVGEWVKKTTDSLMYKIGDRFRLESYEIKDGQIWCNLDNGSSWLMSVCEPCDPPADHDTPAGKEAAEAVIRDSQMTAIKVGDVVEVFQASGNMTFKADIGAGGIVKSIVPASKELHAHAMIESNGNLRLPAGRSVSLCDVRKVPQ